RPARAGRAAQRPPRAAGRTRVGRWPAVAGRRAAHGHPQPGLAGLPRRARPAAGRADPDLPRRHRTAARLQHDDRPGTRLRGPSLGGAAEHRRRPEGSLCRLLHAVRGPHDRRRTAGADRGPGDAAGEDRTGLRHAQPVLGGRAAAGAGPMTWSVRVLDPRTDPEPAGWAAFLEAQQAPLTWDYGLLGTESRPSR